MANTNKLKFTAWTASGTRVEMGTGPLVGVATHLIDLLTAEQLYAVQAHAAKRAEKIQRDGWHK